MREARLAAGLAALVLLFNVSLLKSEILVRVSDEVYTYQMIEFGGRLWVATDDGAHIMDNDTLIPVLKDIPVRTIAQVNDRIWFGSEQGVYEFAGQNSIPIFRDSIGALLVTVIRPLGDVVLIGTSNGLFLVENNNPKSTFITDEVSSIEVISDRLWIGTNSNAYWLDNFVSRDSDRLQKIAKRVFGADPVSVREILSSGGDTWLITTTRQGIYGPCFRIGETGPAYPEERLRKFGVISLEHVDNETWFATTQGVIKIDSASQRPLFVGGLREPVNTIAEIDDEVWIGTPHRVYRKAKSGFEVIPAEERFGSKRFYWGSDVVWTWGESGLFKLKRPPRSYLSYLYVSLLLGLAMLYAYVYRRRSVELQIEQAMGRFLEEPELDNYDGYACASILDHVASTPKSKSGDTYRISFWLQPEPPESEFTERIRIREGSRAREVVEFRVKVDTDTLTCHPNNALIGAPVGAPSEPLIFTVVPREKESVHLIWFEISQKNQVLQNVMVTLKDSSKASRSWA